MTPTKVLDIDPEGREKLAKGDGRAVLDLPVFVVENVTFSRWKLSDEERAEIAAGGDMLVAVLNQGLPLHPMLPVVTHAGAIVAADHLEAIQVELCA